MKLDNAPVRSPGKKCSRCGADNSRRAPGTKYCYKCARELAAEKEKIRRDNYEKWTLRDTAIMPVSKACVICELPVAATDYFCRHCGQRLRSDSNG